MRVLIDTHVFLWWTTNDPRLSSRAGAIISDRKNEIFLSAASAWEIAIKTAKKRLVLPEKPAEYVSSRMRMHGFQPLQVNFSHVLRVYDLPAFHDDPFDRLLIAQSELENLPLITSDGEIKRYEIMTIW